MITIEALPFYEKLGYEPCAQPIKLVGDDKAQVGITDVAFRLCSSTSVQLIPMIKKMKSEN